MDLPEQYGQYQVKLGSNRQNHVITKGTYQNVVIDAMFSSSYGAYANTTGILLQFADGKGILLGFQDQDGIGGTNFKLTYRTDNESYKFGMVDTLTGWIGDNGELTNCKPMKQEWKEKFDSENGLILTLIRNGNVLLTYVDGTLVNMYELPAEYQESACKVGFFSNWGACDIPFALSGTLADVDVTVSGIDSLEHGMANLSQNSYKLGDAIVLNVNPANGYKLKNITVDGKNMTANVADGKLTLGYATVEKTYAITATFIEEKDSYDVTFSYDTTKYTADGLVITLTKGSDTKTVTLGNGAVVNGLAVGEWAATAQFGGMTVSLGNFDIQVDEFFVDLGRVFDGSGAITGADFTNNTFDYKMFVKSHEDFQPAFMTEATGIAEGNAFFMTKISLDAASQGVITSSKAWCVVRLFMQVGDSRQEIMLAYNHFENAFRLIQLPDWTMVDLSTDLKTAYESGNGIYVVWGYNAESGGMDIYAGTTKENVAKVGSFRADAFPKNGTVSAVGFGDGLWGNPDFSVTVELNYGATLNEALGLTESE